MGLLHPSEGARDRATAIPGPGRVGPYRLESELGAGGMSDVYRAVDERLDRPVAVKYIQPPFARDRFRREAKVIAQLSHPAIVQVFDVIEDEAGGWIVMELVEGRQLSRLIADGPLDLALALQIFVDLADALTEAHAKDILHRDIKADNVMVTPAGRGKLLDFGLARWIELDPEKNLTLDGQIIGTPHAMSPEQAMSLELDHRSDLFSFGALLYEATTGIRPFHGAGIVGTLKKVCVEQQRPAHELNPSVPEELSSMIDRMLEKEPARRPDNAGAVARALRRLPRSGVLDRRTRARGATDAAPASSEASLPAARSAPSGERRTITILHCELASASSPSGSLDPEELFEARPELQRIAARAAARFEGEVGEYLDQGLRLFFGYPRAHGDDARRAVYAAREIVAGVEGLFGSANKDLGIRVGIHTGPALVAASSRTDGLALGAPLALGETGNLAAAVQRLASPGEILLSVVTHEIVEAFFQSEARPASLVHGFSEPIETYRWLGEASSSQRSV